METTHHNNEMSADHSFCESGDEEKQKEHQHHDCEWKLICACNISESALSDKEWIPKTKDSDVILTVQENQVPFYYSEEFNQFDQLELSPYTSPPLYLLYDTLLM